MEFNLAQGVDGGPLGGPDGGPLGGPEGGRKVVQMADRLEDLKVARTEDRSVGRWAVLTADHLGA